jgi:ligand-binding sensor domain-containing protein
MALKASKLFIFFILAGSTLVFSQGNRYLCQNYTSADGLPNNYIRCLYQDSYGYLWVGTRRGLSKFDGYKFCNYDRFSELYSDPPYPSMIFEDTNLQLWIANHNLLYTYDSKKDRFDLVRDDNTFGMYDKSGNLWIAFNDGIYKIGTQELKSIDPSILNLICKEKSNRLAVFAKINEFKIKPFAKIYYPKPGESLIYNELGFALSEDSEGTIWCFFHSGGAYQLKQNSSSFSRFSYKNDNSLESKNSGVNTIYEQDQKKYWFGTDAGIDIFDKSSKAITHIENNTLDKFSISNNKITSLYEDRTGNVWVGTKYGLNRVYKNMFSHLNNFNNKSPLLSNNSISFLEDKLGQIWISTSLAIVILSPDLNKITQIPVREKDPESITAAPQYIYQDKKNQIWIGTWGSGLAKYNPEKKTFDYFMHKNDDSTSISGNGIFGLTEDSHNNFWVSLWGTGLDLFDPGKKQFRNFNQIDSDPFSISGKEVSQVFEDSRPNLWVGTSSGLNILKDKEKGIFQRFIHKDSDGLSISGNYINCIFESNEHELWIGTDTGLNKFIYSSGTFISYNKNDGLSSDEILGILEDNSGNLWVSNIKGLSRIIFNKERSKIASVQNFDFRKNNPNEFNPRSCLKHSNGTMFFGGLNGIVYFHPDSIKQNLIEPKTVITNLKIFNKDVNIGDKVLGKVILKSNLLNLEPIELSYKHSVFTLEFAGLHFENPEANQYKYMLEGFDTEWTETDASARYATYTNLDGGNYNFKVLSSNSDGIWNETPIVLPITIVPPFWKTNWFKAFVILLVALIIIVVFRARVYLLKKQKKELQRQVIERTREVVHQKENIEQQNLVLESQKIEILEQSSRIEKMNQLLEKHNIELVEDIKELAEARVMQKLIDYNEFKEIFKNEEDCYNFLVNLKWGKGFTCKKCKSVEYSSKEPYVRRCKKCNYVESVTSYTIFHHLRFPIDKAFYILILTSSGREINVSQLSTTITLRLKTCWAFYTKVKLIMSQRKRFKNPKEGWKELILLDKKIKSPTIE